MRNWVYRQKLLQESLLLAIELLKDTIRYCMKQCKRHWRIRCGPDVALVWTLPVQRILYKITGDLVRIS